MSQWSRIYNHNFMKNILLATVVLGLMSCSSQKQLETNTLPFEIGQSSFQKWSGGREESGTGAELKIIVSEALQEDLSFEKIYFRGRALDCKLKTENGISAIISAYKDDEKANMAHDKDGKKMQESFELQPDQAIIAFKEADEKLKYTKVNGIKEKAPILYKGRPKN